MSYASQAQLYGDTDFQGRVISVNVQQATIYKDDARADWVAVALAVGRGDPDMTMAFLRFDAAGPGIADKVDTGDGTINQSLVTDDDLLALTQANWPTVAALYFNADGTPIGGNPA